MPADVSVTALFGCATAVSFVMLLSLSGLLHVSAEAQAVTTVASSSRPQVRDGGVGTIITVEDRKGTPAFDERAFMSDLKSIKADEDEKLRQAALAEAQKNPPDPLTHAESYDAVRSRVEADLIRHSTPAPAGCGTRLSFLTIFGEDELTCSPAGYTFPVIANGQCPISACILKWGMNEPSVFSRWMDF